MGKVVWKIILIALPILIVIGLFRVALHSEGIDFLPTWAELVGYFASAPAPYELVAEPMELFSNSMDDLSTVQIQDLPSFFSAIGTFFKMVGSALNLTWSYFTIPFQYLGWFIKFIAGFAY